VAATAARSPHEARDALASTADPRCDPVGLDPRDAIRATARLLTRLTRPERPERLTRLTRPERPERLTRPERLKEPLVALSTSQEISFAPRPRAALGRRPAPGSG
jgi:hypothetical protein